MIKKRLTRLISGRLAWTPPPPSSWQKFLDPPMMIRILSPRGWDQSRKSLPAFWFPLQIHLVEDWKHSMTFSSKTCLAVLLILLYPMIKLQWMMYSCQHFKLSIPVPSFSFEYIALLLSNWVKLQIIHSNTATMHTGACIMVFEREKIIL